uniref:Uncharacterized protein n=1 Tax=Globodera rostochiensis TaxID=31243 RepID=A0A914H2U9_GLORO
MRWASVHQCKWRGTKGQKNEMNWLYWCGQINSGARAARHSASGLLGAFGRGCVTMPLVAEGVRGAEQFKNGYKKKE